MAEPKQKILIIYEFFYPAYKAGGVIQSLNNIVKLLQGNFEFYCITGGYDLNETEPLENIQLNQWNDINRDGQARIKVWYDDKKRLDLIKMKSLIRQVNPNTIYINGFMHIAFLLNPLWVIKYSEFRNTKPIVAPRGMLQSGALSTKSLKKTWYLKLIQLLGLTKNIHWHITAEDEREGINQYFPAPASRFTLLGNIPQLPVTAFHPSIKTEGVLSIVYASIITEKKNLHFTLESLRYCTSLINFSIYGVIKEADYWNKCEVIINSLPENINVKYFGAFKPADMQQIVSKHNAFILLSKGENFSHAIFEALGTPRPIITSHFTSWNNLEEKKAGWNLTIDHPQATGLEIEKIAQIENDKWQKYLQGAHDLANTYLAQQNFKTAYTELFNIS